MTSVVLENAVFAGSIKNAALVAPTKGASFDQAHGIILDLSPDEELPVSIRATDLSLFFTEWVNVLEASGDPVTWRVASGPLSRIAAALPTRAGSTITLTEDKGKLCLASGRMKATLNCIPYASYPGWDVFEPSGLSSVQAFGQALKQVGWAAGKDPGTAFNGIHLTGEVMVATDRYRMAQIPFKIDIPKPVTIPAGILTGLVGDLTESSIAVRNGTLLIMPDSHTQIRTVLSGLEFPAFTRVQQRDFDNTVMIDREDFADMIMRCRAIGSDDRMPTLRMWVGREEVACMMENGEKGKLGDVIDVPSQATHERVEIKFNPDYLIETIRSCPGDKVLMSYNMSKVRVVYFTDGSGYEAWVMPITGIGEKT